MKRVVVLVVSMFLGFALLTGFQRQSRIQWEYAWMRAENRSLDGELTSKQFEWWDKNADDTLYTYAAEEIAGLARQLAEASEASCSELHAFSSVIEAYNCLGEMGWELVTTTESEYTAPFTDVLVTTRTYYFKRQR